MQTPVRSMPGAVFPLLPSRAFLRQPPVGPSAPDDSGGLPAPGTALDDHEHDQLLRCARCGHPVTSEGRRRHVAGSHRHVFANPVGVIFEIGCFSEAPGCAAVGTPSREFSWFSGMAWQVAVCAACGLHLGWRFAGDGPAFFFGLILSRLYRDHGTLDR